MEKETKLFVVIFIVLLVSVFSCWILGQKQEPKFEQQTIKCVRPVDTVITMTMTGYGLDWDNKTIVDYNTTATQTITVCNPYKIYFPLIIKNAKRN